MEDEQLNVVDEDDNVIRTEWRNSLPRKLPKGQYLRYVNIFVINSKKELLIPVRSMNRRLFPGCFDFSVAEHVMSGESYDDKIPFYDKEGISKLTWVHIDKVKDLWSKDNSKFKNDFILNFNYWIENIKKKQW